MQTVRITATQILIAIKCYKEKYGKLPEKLEELVPEYFDEVPVDPYDGKPMRYDPVKKIIYSVGEDLIDSGGSDGFVSDEPTLKIEF